jgi:protein-S-isoprenylcysteine O-methyltransferase Ste14
VSGTIRKDSCHRFLSTLGITWLVLAGYWLWAARLAKAIGQKESLPGLLTVFLGNAVMVGDRRGRLAVAIVLVSFWRKFRPEKVWLAEHFGNSYRLYQTRTKALIPAVL